MPIKIGQTWERREPLNDEFDTLLVLGKQGITENAVEWTLQPVGGLQVVSATAASLQEAFQLVSESDATPAPDNALGYWCDG